MRNCGRQESVSAGNSLHFPATPSPLLTVTPLLQAHPLSPIRAKMDYEAFKERVKHTVYLDNLSPQVSKAVIRTALDQFGSAINIQFIPNYFEPKNTARCALVELENESQALSVIKMLTIYPFMMSGMPRPVRVQAAEEEMFDDRPAKPGRKIQLYWVDPSDPDFQVAQKLKDLTKKHSAEASCLLKHQLAEEEKLSNQQAETLKAAHHKFDIVDTILNDGTSERLARHYNVTLTDNAGF
ncbi:hypothetical protein Nepgr_012322 [Nepenthes gracilis]|uniref:RRM domain-containing protein n=1 Tax=Nepenthes gracilis TaxID=150966 RepID=A0AAD3SHB4_NEPGR|nr:hypothetical protein Nepgr_012322 [Nepenthes gracilis]